ncbi:MAG: hypothetical protein R3F59_39180, partial [Myxococcota bacterium]
RLGFGGDDEASRREATMERARQQFRPELLNRLDGVVVFRDLDPDDLRQVVALHLERLRQRAADSGVRLTWEPEVAELCARRYREPGMGARPALRAIDDLVAVPLGQALISAARGRDAHLHAVVRDGRVEMEEPAPQRQENAPSDEEAVQS